MKFDAKRYARESRDRDLLEGQRLTRAEEYDQAEVLFSRAYQNGNMLAGVKLGMLYHEVQEYGKAVPLFEEGARRGCPLAAEWLAECYRAGAGVPKDEERARQIWESCRDALRAMCRAGSSDACYAYGFVLVDGSYKWGTVQEGSRDTRERAAERRKGLRFLRKARRQGHMSAGVMIAKAYFYGWGVRQDQKKGIRLLEWYADNRDEDVHLGLGLAYFCGIGGKEQDFEKAAEHLAIAAECGNEEARRALEVIRANT